MATLTFPAPFDYYTTASYTNGSLWSQVWNNPNLSYTDDYSLPSVDPDVNLYIYPNDYLDLEFRVGNGNVSLAMPLLLMLLSPNATRVDIYCSYPLSGQYDRLQRFLFYGTLIVALLFRRNGLLATAAIGVAMTYSALAAVHLFVLLTWYQWKASFDWGDWDSETSVQYGDVDFFGIFPIITATGVMLTPMLTWSSTIRTHEARVVVVYWAILIFAAMVPTIWLYNREGDYWTPDYLQSFAYCTTDPISNEACTWWNLENYMTTSTYQACNCVDFCALFSPDAPLRKGTNMAALIGLPFTERLNSESKPLNNAYRFIYIIWIFALAQGVLSLVSFQSSPNMARNVIFAVLNADTATIIKSLFKGQRRERLLKRFCVSDETFGPKNTRVRVFRRFLAKSVATLYLILIIFGAIVYPAVFIVSIVLSEFVTDQYPVGEESDSVGAWSPFVGAGLVILASLIMDYHHSLVTKLGNVFIRPLHKLQYGPIDRPEKQSTSWNGFKVTRQFTNFLEMGAALFKHSKFLISYRKWRIRGQLKLWREWWNNPEVVSDAIRWAEQLGCDVPQKSDHNAWLQVSEYRWSMERGNMPECDCKLCDGRVPSLHEVPKLEQKISPEREKGEDGTGQNEG